jgi:hypothetical protein
MEPTTHELQYLRSASSLSFDEDHCYVPKSEPGPPSVDSRVELTALPASSGSLASDDGEVSHGTLYPSKQPLYSRIISSWRSMPWNVELLCWLSSLGLFILTSGVLKFLDHRPLPKLQVGITPNAMIGLLASFGQSFLMVPVSSSIGQLKWLRVLQKRPMTTFQALDRASRGPSGSFLLLVRGNGG